MKNKKLTVIAAVVLAVLVIAGVGYSCHRKAAKVAAPAAPAVVAEQPAVKK